MICSVEGCTKYPAFSGKNGSFCPAHQHLVKHWIKEELDDISRKMVEHFNQGRNNAGI